jgi:hypothetical protein
MSNNINYYRIADIPFSVETPYRYEEKAPYDLFSAEECDVDFRYNFSEVETLTEPNGVLLYEDPYYRAYDCGGKIHRYVGFYSKGRELDRPIALVVYGEADRAASVMIPQDRGVPKNSAFIYKSLCIEHLICLMNGIMLHSSFIETPRGAILFTAPSGTGKSTQAELWRRYRGASVINGDCSVIRRGADGFAAHGVPFSGTSGICHNKSVKLRAIVYLTQAPQNKIERVRGAAAFAYMMEGIKLNIWSKGDASRATNTVTDILSEIPLFKLDCLPDESAVCCLESALENTEC